MPVAPLHPSEAERLALLHALDVMDTPAEEAFDRITRLLALTLEVPVALISLVDHERQWFKSSVGVDIAGSPRDESVCAHVVASGQPLIVRDATCDPRVWDNPFVTGDFALRMYAGVPILSRAGLPLGTLCAIDFQPRELSARQLQIIDELAGLVRGEFLRREDVLRDRQALRWAQAAAQDNKSRLDAIFEHAPVGIAIVAPDGGWLRVNRALADIVGYAPDALMQLSFQDITHPDDLERDLDLVGALLAGDLHRYGLEKRYIRADGTQVWVNLTVSLLRDATGRPDHFVSIIENIDARKQAELALLDLRGHLEQRVQQRTEELRTANDELTRAIARQVRSERQLRANEAELSAVIENAHDAYISIDDDGVITGWNRQAELTFGWMSEEAIGQSLHELIVPLHLREAHRRGMAHYQATGEGPVLDRVIELPALRRDGTTLLVDLRIKPIEVDGRRMFSAFLHDISARKQAERAREESYEQLQSLTNDLPALVCFLDHDFRLQFANDAYRRFYGIDPTTMIGTELVGYLGRRLFAECQPPLLRALGGERTEFEISWNWRGSGERHQHVVCLPYRVAGRVEGIHVIIRDITEQREAAQRMEREARQDHLTGLPNRRALFERLERALDRRAETGKPMALLFLDLNGFKAVNDTHGHDAGDELLRAIGERLRACTRDGDFAARLAGDEFAMILEGLDDGPDDAERVAARLAIALREPVRLSDGAIVSVGASIGTVVCTTDGAHTPDSLLDAADAAMYQRKNARRSGAVEPA